MIRSMTGFGEAERDTPVGRLAVRIKTVNHRFLNTNIKTPYGFDSLEPGIQNQLKALFHRGHVSVTVSLDREAASVTKPLPTVDVERAAQLHRHLSDVSAELGLADQIDLTTLLRLGDLLKVQETETEEELPAEILSQLVEAACGAAISMREVEGARLEEDLRGRLQAMADELGKVEAQAPVRLVTERNRLRTAIAELADQVEVDEDRLAKEIAYLAEKWDVNEELVRFRSHLELFVEILDLDGSEGAGKRLGFVVQEMHREANTIGSKANDTIISRASVALKEEIERLREQVENIE